MAEPRDEALRRRYRELATEEPSVALDDAIRAAARRGVSAGPFGVRKSASRRWALPVSIAAVFFLSFGVVMRMEQEVPSLDVEMRGAPAASTARAPGPSPMTPSVGSPAVPQVIPEEVFEEKEKLQAKAKEDGQKRRAEAKVSVSTQSGQVAQVQKPEPPPQALAKDLSAPQSAGSRARESAQAPVLAPAPAFVPPPPASQSVASAPATVAAPASPPPPKAAVAPPPTSAAAPVASVSPGAAPPADAMTRQAPASPRSDPAPAAMRDERNQIQGRRDEATGALGFGGAPARAKAEANVAKPEAFAEKKTAEAVTLDLASAPWPDTPEKQLERIEALRKAGRDREADEGLARFKREHPDYRIPEDTWTRIKPR